MSLPAVIDFYKPRSCAGHDRLGYKNFVVALKAILFRNPSRRMTKRVCEEFYNDDVNFDLSYAVRKYPTLRDGLSLV
jgi:hypothetical protein